MRVPAGAAKPGPAIGQALGPLGINMAEFCKQFNERSVTMYKNDVPLSVRLHAMSDRSFTFDLRTPPTSWLIKQVCGMKKGPSNPNPEVATAYITPEAIYEIAKIKQTDDHMWHLPLEGICRQVIGTAKTLGVQVREAEDEDTEESSPSSSS
jgi:large subunit ribosomal protein L11